MKSINITAIERDGWSVRTLAIRFEVLDNKLDATNIRSSVKKAVKEYLTTAEGKETINRNCGCFNWGDVVTNLPNEICEKYGFRWEDSEISDVIVDWDENLSE